MNYNPKTILNVVSRVSGISEDEIKSNELSEVVNIARYVYSNICLKYGIKKISTARAINRKDSKSIIDYSERCQILLDKKNKYVDLIFTDAIKVIEKQG